MKGIRELKAGDRVTIRWNGIEGFTTVSEVSKLNIKTADGGVWKMSGYRWGSDTYCGPWIEPFQPSDEDDLREQQKERRRRALARKLADIRWHEMPLSLLQSVADAIATQQGPARPADAGHASNSALGETGREQ